MFGKMEREKERKRDRKRESTGYSMMRKSLLQMILMCNSFPLPVKMNLTLNSPFWVTHKILTAGDR
jgi:hypothetical protein